MTIELSKNVIDAIADAVVKKMQEPKTGYWIIEVKSDSTGDMWPTNPKCSECGGEPVYSNTIYNYKFCPYCGIKMRQKVRNKHGRYRVSN